MSNLQPVSILLAEDSPTDAEMTMRALKKIGLTNEVVWVKDGQEVLDYIFRVGDYANRSKKEPKLILLDLKMPKIDGIEVLQRLKASDTAKMIPIVMLTSSAEEQDIVRSYALGVNSYLVKPVEFDKFVEEVSKVGCYWTILNKIPEFTQ
ncbi:two-component system response regulator [Methylovorus sp. MM2]|uniref:response regulator n=1 Tax=Methylovorus sp. MM2 TaxID=1848038 RepID=UPI0007DF9C72|nr:response regulator [Methylovorus sp. MM2]OAM52066.1 two-component system response regulator [Methylovorus sp. MM2]